MLEVTADLWTFEPADARVISTNGIVTNWQFNRDGSVRSTAHAVMGRGVALQAAQRYPGLAEWFGLMIHEHGNVTQSLMTLDWVNGKPRFLVSFPVKHHWRDKADLPLIEQSANQLVELTNTHDWKHVILPRVGAGNGRLDWMAVQSVLAPILDDRFIVVHPDAT